MKIFSDIKETVAKRPTSLLKLVGDLNRSDVFEHSIDSHYISDGIVALYRYKDGNAYEVTIKTAEQSDQFDQHTKKRKK